MSEWLLLQEDKRLERLKKIGIKLKALKVLIPWEELFRKDLNALWNKDNKQPQGRRPYDSVMMFKILILQSMYNLSDENMEYMIADRLSFQEFLDIAPDQNVPDARTIWLFRERLKENSLDKRLFERFSQYLNEHGYQAQGGQIVDATFAEVPRQHNTPEENKTIKEEHKAPESWSEKKKRHKDVDASWTKKRNKSYFGFKNHINVDAKHKLIRQSEVTPANVHDSQKFMDVIDSQISEDSVSEDRRVFADSAYNSEEATKQLTKRGLIPKLCHKGCRHKKLTESEKAKNSEISKTRCRVEHVFGLMHQFCHGNRIIRTIGLARAKVKITLSNLAYNLNRYCSLCTGQICPE